ncbi:Wzz/FepE/Etk N-terminal domain-containing protein [Longispora albida]|uniref:Wzz/FepE/Etk N-terminal domain-containing protein n=1 Tax=Longispora albida TaxID=203523 RepID=UPI0003711CC1|nr:Wzz/FepE/Etk N-terminal domain-containing protein [Longispora albida]
MDATRPASYDLSDYLSALRRSWWLALLVALGGVVLAAGFTLTQEKLYQSAASVLVQPTGVTDTNVAGGRTKGEINLDTEAQLVKSTEVSADAGKLMRSTRQPRQLAKRVSVTVPPNTSVLVITYSEHTPRGAQAGAHAFAEAYLANRNESAKAELTGQYNTMDRKIKQVSADLSAIDGRITGDKTADKQADLDSRRTNLTNQLNALTSRFNQLATTTVNGGKIISDADLPNRAVKPNTALNLGSGALTGLVLGVGFALGRERFDRKVRRGIDLPRRADVALLAELPVIGAAFEPLTEPGRIFARLRNEIVAATSHRVLVVTGAAEGPGAGLVAAQLAGAFQHAGNDTELITDYATDAGGQLQVEPVRRRVEELRGRAEYVIIEAPSTAASADAQSLASLADAALVVVELRRTTHAQVLDAAEQLRRVDTVLLGGLVTPKLPARPAEPVQVKAEAAQAART